MQNERTTALRYGRTSNWCITDMVLDGDTEEEVAAAVEYYISLGVQFVTPSNIYSCRQRGYGKRIYYRFKSRVLVPREAADEVE